MDWARVTEEESFSYTNWATGEPNNFQGIEDKLLFFGEGSLMGPKWNDGSSSFKAKGYIIEWEPQEEQTEPGPTAVPGQII